MFMLLSVFWVFVVKLKTAAICSIKWYLKSQDLMNLGSRYSMFCGKRLSLSLVPDCSCVWPICKRGLYTRAEGADGRPRFGDGGSRTPLAIRPFHSGRVTCYQLLSQMNSMVMQPFWKKYCCTFVCPMVEHVIIMIIRVWQIVFMSVTAMLCRHLFRIVEFVLNLYSFKICW